MGSARLVFGARKSALCFWALSFALSGCAADEPTRTTIGPVGGDPAGDGDGDDGTEGDGSDGDGSNGDGEEEPDIGKPLEPGDCAAIRKEAPEASGGVDVIMLLDTSGSMLHATTQVTANLSKFIQTFEGTNADTRVVMITGSDPAAGTPVANDKDSYRFIKATVDSKQLFAVAVALFPQYKDFLRPNAATQFVMITDDEDAIDPAQFKSQMDKLLGHEFTQHAIASENADGFACFSEATKNMGICLTGLPPIPAVCGAAAIGARYYKLAEMTDGKTMSICKSDWTPVFDQLKEAVIAAVPLPCDYPIEDAQGEGEMPFDPKKVQIVYSRDGQDNEFPRAAARDACSNKAGWFYDNPDAPKVISLCPAACEAVQKGGSIDLGFGCEPILLL